MKAAIALILLFYILPLNSQTVFSETFDEADDAIIGTDAIGAVAWETLCPGSVAIDDYFKVNSGKLEARDTNGPSATWTTEDIDISSCGLGLTISLIIEELSNMEECIDCGGSGIGCIDWVKLEYNIDGAGWMEVAGETCALAASPGEMIQIGDLTPDGGPEDITSPCLDLGTTMQIRITCACWAGAEVWRFDDIIVECSDCLLPIEIENFNAQSTSQNSNLISWSTITERNNDYFTIEKSSDGVNFNLISTIDGAGNSSIQVDYVFEDFSIINAKTNYYRLKQVDFNGKSTYSDVISIQNEIDVNVYFGANQINCSLNTSDNQTKTLNLFNVHGQLVYSTKFSDNTTIPWSINGFYIVEIPELNYRQKLIIQAPQ